MNTEIFLWDKKMSINGISPERLSEKFIAENGNDDRVLFADDGVVSRIQRVDEDQFNEPEKANVEALTKKKVKRNQAIADTWKLKLQREETEAQSDELHAELDEIDRRMIRPLSEIVNGTSTEEDENRLMELMDERSRKRETMRGLMG